MIDDEAHIDYIRLDGCQISNRGINTRQAAGFRTRLLPTWWWTTSNSHTIGLDDREI